MRTTRCIFTMNFQTWNRRIMVTVKLSLFLREQRFFHMIERKMSRANIKRYRNVANALHNEILHRVLLGNTKKRKNIIERLHPGERPSFLSESHSYICVRLLFPTPGYNSSSPITSQQARDRSVFRCPRGDKNNFIYS